MARAIGVILKLPAAPTAFLERDAVVNPPPAPAIGVLLVDDQRAILSGVGALIDSEAPRMRVVGRARDARSALELALGTRPDVIVLDVDLGGEDGLALIPKLRSCCGAAIVVFTGSNTPDVRRRARRLGATGFVSKTAPAAELIAAICAGEHVREPMG